MSDEGPRTTSLPAPDAQPPQTVTPLPVSTSAPPKTQVPAASSASTETPAPTAKKSLNSSRLEIPNSPAPDSVQPPSSYVITLEPAQTQAPTVSTAAPTTSPPATTAPPTLPPVITTPPPVTTPPPTSGSPATTTTPPTKAPAPAPGPPAVTTTSPPPSSLAPPVSTAPPLTVQPKTPLVPVLPTLTPSRDQTTVAPTTQPQTTSPSVSPQATTPAVTFTTIPPATQTSSPPEPTTLTPSPTPTANDTLASAAPPVASSQTTADATPSPNSSTVISVSGAGMLLALAAIALILYAFRRRRRNLLKLESDMAPTHDHVELSSPRMNRASITSTWGASELAASRIPLRKIKFGAVINQGGYGEVLRGTYNGQAVAIKRLLVSRRKDQHRIQDLMDEIKLTASLEHECIVKFIGVAWEAPADLCMISELMAGGDLRTLLQDYRRKGMPNGFSKTKLRIAIQVAHALTYLHSLQPVVVHRDLKSRNILLTSDLHARLTDFGVSTERRDYTMTAGVGTSLWMAPEVIVGQRYDEKADIFSFGVVLSELDTHELPYEETRAKGSGREVNDLVMMQKICNGEMTPRFTEAAHPSIVELARDCLRLDPSSRPTAADVLYHIHRNQSSTLHADF